VRRVAARGWSGVQAAGVRWLRRRQAEQGQGAGRVAQAWRAREPEPRRAGALAWIQAAVRAGVAARERSRVGAAQAWRRSWRAARARAEAGTGGARASRHGRVDTSRRWRRSGDSSAGRAGGSVWRKR
jgi:hypothetical protein